MNTNVEVSANGLWFVFPIWGSVVSICLIYQDSCAIFVQAGLPW